MKVYRLGEIKVYEATILKKKRKKEGIVTEPNKNKCPYFTTKLLDKQILYLPNSESERRILNPLLESRY